MPASWRRKALLAVRIASIAWHGVAGFVQSLSQQKPAAPIVSALAPHKCQAAQSCTFLRPLCAVQCSSADVIGALEMQEFLAGKVLQQQLSRFQADKLVLAFSRSNMAAGSHFSGRGWRVKQHWHHKSPQKNFSCRRTSPCQRVQCDHHRASPSASEADGKQVFSAADSTAGTLQHRAQPSSWTSLCQEPWRK